MTKPLQPKCWEIDDSDTFNPWICYDAQVAAQYIAKGKQVTPLWAAPLGAGIIFTAPKEGALVAKEQPAAPRYAAGTEARKIEAGGKRLPGGVMSPEAAEALALLVERGYAASMLKAIERALIGAAGRYKRE